MNDVAPDERKKLVCWSWPRKTIALSVLFVALTALVLVVGILDVLIGALNPLGFVALVGMVIALYVAVLDPEPAPATSQGASPPDGPHGGK